ncbi:MAG: hypothetical protein LBU79_01970 [Planctomycetota bacterium]|jgi:xylulokinase|nr:hypothetical protein [Planctomycetota bacterium]
MSVLGIDLGTSSCKVGVFNETGLLAAAGREYPILSPAPGYAELDPVAAWNSVKESLRDALSQAGPEAGKVQAISFSSMGEVIVPLDKDGVVVSNALHSYDIRGSEYSESLLADIGQEAFYRINPNSIGPYYSLSKMLWFRDHLPERYRQTAKFLLMADFIAYRFGAKPFTSNSLANRTLLFDYTRNDWSDTLLDWAKFPREKLGAIVSGGTVVGEINPEVARELSLPPDIILVSGGHDQGCNSLGCGATRPGMAVAGMGTYETFCPTIAMPPDPLNYLREIRNLEHHVLPGLFVSFLYTHSGLLINWFRKTFAPELQPTAGKSPYQILDSEMPAEPTNIFFLPHNEPLQWPDYQADTSGVFIGLKTATTRGEMFKALLEGIAFFFADSLVYLERMGMKPDSFIASGGSSRSDAILQIRADVLDITLTRLETGEGSLTGAAILAARAAGMFKTPDEAVKAYTRLGRTFTPDPGRREFYRQSAAFYQRLDHETSSLRSALSRR